MQSYLWLFGYCNSEYGSIVYFWANANLAAQFFNRFFNDIQPQSRAAALVAGAVKHIKNFVEMLILNAYAIVFHRNHSLFVWMLAFDLDFRFSRDVPVFYGIRN